MAKVGRPKTDNPKENKVTIRLRKQDLIRLQKYAEKMELTKSEVLTKGLDMLFREEKKRE